MSSSRTCKQCQAVLAAEYVVDICPGCLLQGAGLDQEEPEHVTAPPVVPGSTRCCGDYTLHEQIGRGGIGVVYRARKANLTKDFALKMLLHADTATPEELERLHIEAETAATIRHPNIVPVFDFGESEGRHYIAMELIEGRSLAQKIAAKEFQMPRGRDAKARARARELQQEIGRLMLAVARAVDHAHQCRFLHRDIKPSNILIDAQGKPFLSDFGLAKALDGSKSISKSGAVLGTVNYMSPEQSEGKRVGFPADVFSLGAVLYELLTGRQPFRGDSIGETLHRLQETEPEHPSARCPWIDTDLATICLKCLEKNPQQRYTSAGDLVEDLENWLANKPVKARPVRFIGRVRRWCQREPRIAALSAGLFLLVTAVAMLTSVLLVQKQENIIRIKKNLYHLRAVLMTRFEEKRKQGEPIRIRNTELSIITQHEELGDGTEPLITLGARTQARTSDRMVTRFAHFTECLQTNLWQQPVPRMRFSLVLYSDETSSRVGVLQREAELYRLDPVVYLQARREIPQLRPLVREAYNGKPWIHGAIITRQGSGITLEQIKSFAFGEKDSALGWFMPRAELVRAGLRASHLVQPANLPSQHVLSEVSKRHFDAGVVRWEHLRNITNSFAAQGIHFKILREFDCPADVWLVAPKSATNSTIPRVKLDPSTIDALRTVLLSLKDKNILMGLESQPSELVLAQPSDYDQLEQAIETSKLFDPP